MLRQSLLSKYRQTMNAESQRGGNGTANHSYCSRVHDGEIVSCQTYNILQRLLGDVVLCPRKSRCSPNDTVCANVANSASSRFNFHSFVVLRARGSDHIFIAPVLVVLSRRFYRSPGYSLSLSANRRVNFFSRRRDNGASREINRIKRIAELRNGVNHRVCSVALLVLLQAFSSRRESTI